MQGRDKKFKEYIRNYLRIANFKALTGSYLLRIFNRYRKHQKADDIYSAAFFSEALISLFSIDSCAARFFSFLISVKIPLRSKLRVKVSC